MEIIEAIERYPAAAGIIGAVGSAVGTVTGAVTVWFLRGVSRSRHG